MSSFTIYTDVIVTWMIIAMIWDISNIIHFDKNKAK